MHTVTATQARQDIYNLLKSVATNHEPVQITGKQSSAVLIAESDWRSIQETLYLLSVPGMRESIIEGINTPNDECSKDLNW